MHEMFYPQLLAAYPQAVRIVDSQSCRPGYLPYPARITFETTTGVQTTCVLKVNKQAHIIAHEAYVLQLLRELQLAVPRVLADPIPLTLQGQSLTALLLSELPGQPLPWIALADLADANLTCHLLHTAVDRLHELTSLVRTHDLGTRLSSVTLEAELQSIRKRADHWLAVPLFGEAVTVVQELLPRFILPLVFSNGDYNPLNFLYSEGKLTGWIDFEHACFEDPYIGFTKFFLWADDESGWGAGVKFGLVERYLYNHNIEPAAFLLRLVLRGLWHIKDNDLDNPPH
jgi:aminoglycoside phosphotransferase